MNVRKLTPKFCRLPNFKFLALLELPLARLPAPPLPVPCRTLSAIPLFVSRADSIVVSDCVRPLLFACAAWRYPHRSFEWNAEESLPATWTPAETPKEIAGPRWSVQPCFEAISQTPFALLRGKSAFSVICCVQQTNRGDGSSQFPVASPAVAAPKPDEIQTSSSQCTRNFFQTG